MPGLDVKDALTIVTGLVTITAVIVSMRSGLLTLQGGQTEIVRQLTALHKRLDAHGERLTKAERHHAVLEERVANLRSSQRFRIPEEPPILRDEE